MNATGVFGVLGLLEERIHVFHLQDTLALLCLATNIYDGLVGGVQVASADEVSNVEFVNLAIAFEVVDLEGELDL